MLSRRHLRIKVLQAVYAFQQSSNERLDLGEKELFKSLDKLYEIYIYQLSFLLEIVDFAKKRIDENKKKFIPTEDDLNPSTRFVENKLVKQIAENKDLIRQIEKYKINWADEVEMVRKIYLSIRESNDFATYMNAEKASYEDDKEIIQKILKKHFTRSENLHYYFEERDIHWSDDFFTANLLIIKTIKSYKPAWDEFHPLPVIFKDDEFEKSNEDKDFTKNLFCKTILKSDEYNTLIDDKVKNWEMDRIAVMDILLIKMALVELLEFSSIPIKVSLNEYIELAKLYSTPKSKVFVNGVLDKLISDLKGQNLIKKTGRGLMDN